jgi:hypothetical protein
MKNYFKVSIKILFWGKENEQWIWSELYEELGI